MNARDTVPDVIPFSPFSLPPDSRVGAFATLDEQDGVTVATDFSNGRLEASYLIGSDLVAVAYVDDDGEPRVDFHERMNVGLAEFRRALVVWVSAWTHAQELAVVYRQQGGPPDAS